MMNIVFDFGAVLVNWRPLEVVRKHFQSRTQSPEAAAGLVSQLFGHSDWLAFDAGLISAEKVTQLSASRLSLPLQAMQGLVDDIADHITPIASSVQVLQSLYEQKKHPLYFLSNMPAPYARGLERHPWMRYFQGGIFSGDHGLIKPQPEIFQKLEALYDLQGQQILFIDDHAANISAAQKAGWQTIHLTEPSKLSDLLRAYLVLPTQ